MTLGIASLLREPVSEAGMFGGGDLFAAGPSFAGRGPTEFGLFVEKEAGPLSGS